MRGLLLAWLACTALAVTYTPTDPFMANPERGYMRSSFVSTSGCDEPSVSGACAGYPYATDPNCAAEGGRYHCYEPLDLTSEILAPADTSGATAAEPWRSKQPYRSVIWRTVYMNSAVSTLQTVPNIILKGIADDFVQLRSAGFKAYYRFAYARNYPRPWGSTNQYYTEPNDINIIKAHATQLLQVINANKDLVVGVNLGFLGYYGEGHWWDESCNCQRTPRDPSWSNSLISHFLSTLDPSLTLSVRVPGYKASYDPSWAPLDASTPFSDPRRRVALHNDCFMADPTDAGTFARESSGAYPEGSNSLLAACSGTPWGASRFTSRGLSCDRDYFKNEATYTHAMGETCAQGRASCSAFQTELKSYKYSLLNLDWSPAAYSQANAACHDVIRRSIGYRLEINSASYSESGGIGSLTVTLVNSGYARLIKNKLIVAVVGGVSFLGDSSTVASDFRSIGSTPVSYTISISTGSLAGSNLPIYLGITDAGETLRNNKKYNIRLASSITWDSATGLHNTGLVAKAGSPPPATPSTTPSPPPATPSATPSPPPPPASTCGVSTRCLTLSSGNPKAVPKGTPFTVTLYNLPVDRTGNSDYLGFSATSQWGSWIGNVVYTAGYSPFSATFTAPSAGTYYVHYYSPYSNWVEKATLVLTVV